MYCERYRLYVSPVSARFKVLTAVFTKDIFLLGCYVVLTGKSLLTVRRLIVLWSSVELCGPEDESIMILRNVGSSLMVNTTENPRKRDISSVFNIILSPFRVLLVSSAHCVLQQSDYVVLPFIEETENS